ncbi:MAG TPA: HAMP domain-containing protein, partial [Actinomycetota bacterium]|nr:HAMP domain-containing protein [Actinomycetota bacterium]
MREGDLTARVSPKTYDEVGVLGETFDQMTVSLAQLTRDLRDTADEQLELRRRLETILQSMTATTPSVIDCRMVSRRRRSSSCSSAVSLRSRVSCASETVIW